MQEVLISGGGFLSPDISRESKMSVSKDLRDYLAKDVSQLDKLIYDRKISNDSFKEVMNPIRARISEYAEAIKAGCLTTDDFNDWKSARFAK